jgi:hypothetical protein
VTSVEVLHHGGVVHRGGGKVRLLRPDELPDEWDPSRDRRLPVWEATHHLLRHYCHEKPRRRGHCRVPTQAGLPGRAGPRSRLPFLRPRPEEGPLPGRASLQRPGPRLAGGGAPSAGDSPGAALLRTGWTLAPIL